MASLVVGTIYFGLAADIGAGGKSYIGKFVHKYHKNTIGDIIEEMGYKYVDVLNGEQFTHYTGEYNGVS